MKRITLSSSQSLVKYVVNPDHIMNIHGFSHDPVGCRIAFVDGSRLNVDETVQEVLDQLDSIPKVESFPEWWDRVGEAIWRVGAEGTERLDS